MEIIININNRGNGKIIGGGQVVASVTYAPKHGIVSVERNGNMASFRSFTLRCGKMSDVGGEVAAHLGLPA